MSGELAGRDHATWGLFADWCAALDVDALPASPTVLAAFLRAHPATHATHRRRVVVINAVHRAAGFPAPGTVAAVRLATSAVHATRRRRLTDAVLAAEARLTDAAGWPTALFARRDTLLLALAATGLPITRLATLRLGDVTATGHELHVATESAGTAPVALGMGEGAAVDLWMTWQQIRALQHHAPSTWILAGYLTGELQPRVPPAPSTSPVFTPLDRWGAAPLSESTGLSPASVGAILTSYLTGTPVPHQVHRRRDTTVGHVPDVPAPPLPRRLDPGTVDRGLAARHQALEDLADIPDRLDSIEAAADDLDHLLAALLSDQGL